MPHNGTTVEGRLRGWLELGWPELSKHKTELVKRLIPPPPAHTHTHTHTTASILRYP